MAGELSFEELGLSDVTLEALKLAGYSEPTPVQAGVIPPALRGADVVGQARTGTGKTAAFALPILEQLEKGKSGAVQALVLVPTRELAVQVSEEFIKLGHGRRVHVVAVYGGKPIRGQIDKLKRGAHVVVGTPGRLLDHIARGTLQLQDVRCVVLDEADRMLDIGFRPDIEKILRRCPSQRQTMLLSATVPPPIERLAQRYMKNPEKLDLSPSEIGVSTIEQYYFTVDQEQKFELLVRLLKREEPQQAIVFCRTKRGTERNYLRLSKKFDSVGSMHGDMQQGARDHVMDQFRKGKLRILVATDVVGRGIDVTSISHIINYDTPQFCDDYIHRVGRTGRMGREGVAFTFVTPEEGGELTRIEMRIDRLLKRDEISGFDAELKKKKPARAADGAAPAADGAAPAADGAPPEEAPKPPPFDDRRRKRYRRAL